MSNTTEILQSIKLLSIKVFVLFVYVLNLLVGNIYGILIFSLLLHYFSPYLGLGQPLTAQELALWIEQLPSEYKITIFSSLLTIVGFLIAFSIGSTQQKQQLIAQMKIEVASDIEEFFNEVSRKVTDVEIYAKYLIKISSIIDDGSDKNSIEFHMQHIINETNKFIKTREFLTAKSIEVHRFTGRYSIILASSWGINSQLKKTITAFSEITDTMWFPTPLIYQDTKNKELVFMHHVNVDDCQKYVTAYTENYLLMNKITGSMRGKLIGSITGLNLSFIINLLKLKRD